MNDSNTPGSELAGVFGALAWRASGLVPRQVGIGGQQCRRHGEHTACADHGCPQCAADDDRGTDECEDCATIIRTTICQYHGGSLPCEYDYCPSYCPMGEDCPICPDCPVTDKGAATCACRATLCKECSKCSRHADACCTEAFGGGGRAYCEGHGWVQLCQAHGTCEGRGGECALRPYAAGNPDCTYCQGAGCKVCHPHCPACWAELTMRTKRKSLAVDFPPPPPACAGCVALLSGEMVTRVNEWLDLLEGVKRDHTKYLAMSANEGALR